MEVLYIETDSIHLRHPPELLHIPLLARLGVLPRRRWLRMVLPSKMCAAHAEFSARNEWDSQLGAKLMGVAICSILPLAIDRIPKLTLVTNSFSSPLMPPALVSNPFHIRLLITPGIAHGMRSSARARPRPEKG